MVSILFETPVSLPNWLLKLIYMSRFQAIGAIFYFFLLKGSDTRLVGTATPTFTELFI